MASKIKILFLFIALALFLHFLILAKVKINELQEHASQSLAVKEKVEKKEIEVKGIGEKMAYDIKLGGITLGRAKFEHIKSVKLDGKLLSVMVFETSLPRFKDTEIIYSDPKTFLPIKIERNILGFLSKEEITENYDQKEFTVTIKKRKGGREESIAIKKDGPIHNAILLPHFVRYIAKLDPEKTLLVNLPSRQIEIKLVSTEEITVPAGTFKTYHFKSTPKQIEIWLSADSRRIPVKIQSTAALGYLMVLRECNF